MTQRFGQISTLGGIFSPIFRMHGHILIKLFFHNYSLPGPHDIGFKGRSDRQHFPKVPFTDGGIPNRRFAIEDYLVSYCQSLKLMHWNIQRRRARPLYLWSTSGPGL